MVAISALLSLAFLVVFCSPAVDSAPYLDSNKKVTKDGRTIWDGDMILTDEQIAAMNGDTDFRTARKDLRSRWPNGRIPFKIDASLNAQRNLIATGYGLWNANTCVNFVETPGVARNVPHLVLTTTGTGCNSWVGIFNSSSQEQTVSMDKGCWSVSTVAHELGHALGLWHEQDRPDRNQTLNIYTKNMDQKNHVHFRDIFDIDTYGVPYDYASVMQYKAYDMSNNGRLTMAPVDPLAEAIMGYSDGPTFYDYQIVNLMYNCSRTCPAMNCANGGYAAMTSTSGGKCRCLCKPGFGGATCTNQVPVAAPCTYTITSETTIRTPKFPAKTPMNTHCAWLIKAPAGKREIEVTFTTFDFLGRYDKDNSCVWDFLRVRSGNLQGDDPGVQYCGQELNNKMLAYQGTNMLLVLSTTNQADYQNTKGFEATVRFK